MNRFEKNISDDLHKIIDEIKICDDRLKYQSLIELFDLFLNVINDNILDVEMPKDYELFLNKFNISELEEKNEKLFINYCNKYYELDYKFAKIYNGLKTYYKDYYSYPNYNVNIKIREIIPILNKVLKKYDYELNAFFEDFLLLNRMCVLEGVKDDNDGFVIEGNSFIKPYLFINTTNTIADLLTLGHEVVHAYIAQKRKDITEKNNIKINLNNLDETYSHFIELIIMEELKNIQVLTNDSILAKYDFNNNLIEDLRLYKNCLRKKDLFLNENDVELFINSQAYSQGRVFAYHFYNQYLIDRDCAKNNILNFMLKSHIHDKKYMFNHYGIMEKEIFNSKLLVKHF